MSPIIVFAFNRKDALENTIQALLRNEEAKESDLFVFVDGPRHYKAGEEAKVQAVRDYVKSIAGFRSVTCSISEVNKGLGPSIISGVSQVIDRFGTAIVVEDDLVVSNNFLSFMNQGLERYKDEEKVFSVCGYSNRVNVPDGYTDDAYFCVRSSSWGWATWTDRWHSVDWKLEDWYETVVPRRKAFNRWGGSDCFKMLEGWRTGKNKSWAIRFCYAQFVQDKLSLFPIVSKVNNEGFDGEGTNCKKWSRFKFDFDNSGNKLFRFPERVEMNSSLYKSAMRYHSLAIRAYSKLMYIIHG